MKRTPIIPRTFEEAVADVQTMKEAMEAGQQHDAEFCSTDAGRRAFELRERARGAAQAGDHRTAVPLLQQAIALFPPDSDSVAVAALRHDLAKVIDDDPMGHQHRLLLVRNLLEPAVASKARRRYPLRWAISASLLASTLRELAMIEPDEAERARLLDRAESLFREAADNAEAGRSWLEATGYWFNLGNLQLQRDDSDAAIGAYERALQCARPFQRTQAFRAGPEFTRVLVNLGGLLKQRGGRGDERRARELLERAVELDHPEAAHEARFVLAELLVEARERARAAKLLEQVDLGMLQHRHLDRAARLFERAGLAAECLRRLHRLVEQSLRERAATIADLLADRAERRLQQRAFVLAEALLRSRREVDAFLILDNTSALRFAEVTHRYTFRVRDPISRGLRDRFEAAGITAGTLEEALDRLRGFPPEDWAGILATVAASIRGDGDPRSPLFADARVALAEATAGATLDLTPIERALELAVQQAHRARVLLAQREPDPTLRLLEEDVDRAELHRLLAAEPGQVFLRFALGRGGWMLVISAFLEGGDVRARSTSVRIPDGLFDLLDRHERERTNADLAARLTSHLAELDLTAALPDGHRRVAVVLPSSLPARLPLAALGPTGARLLDRFDTITWLPSLFPLRTRQASHRPRHGTLTVTPAERGRTHLHALALRRPLPGEHRLERDAATVAAVQRDAPHADVICFYAHGRYIHSHSPDPATDRHPPGPTLSLADDERLTLFSLSDQWEGAERVELWCCQTGVNLPMDPMAVLVDEAFGLDYEFLRVGVRSAIGSLYTVPEFVGAVITDHFRERLLAGASPSLALAEAQRHWSRDALPRLLAHLRADPVRGFTRFGAEFGFRLPPTADPADPSLYEQLWSCPVAWASFRFIGVADRRPLAPWDPALDRPLTDAEAREVDALVSGPTP